MCMCICTCKIAKPEPRLIICDEINASPDSVKLLTA